MANRAKKELPPKIATTVGDSLTVADLHFLNQARLTLLAHRVALLDQLNTNESSTDSLRDVLEAVRLLVLNHIGKDVDLR
jgi:hypothetical protein